jgi:hypothetical protein
MERLATLPFVAHGRRVWANYLVDPDARLVLPYMIQHFPNRTDLGELIPALSIRC